MDGSTQAMTNLMPGRVRGEWLSGSLYLVGDLICVWYDVPSQPEFNKYLWFVAKQTHYSVEDTKPGINTAMAPETDDYWEVSQWASISEEFALPERTPNLLCEDNYANYRVKFHNNTYVSPETRFQRAHSVNPEMLDAFILGKGVPSWYYYDLMGIFNARAEIKHSLELLTTMRGTIMGLKAWLNLLNLTASVTRIAPEEYYELKGITDEDGQNKQLSYSDNYLPGYEENIVDVEGSGWFKQIQQVIELPDNKIRLWTLHASTPSYGVIVWKKGYVVSYDSVLWQAENDIRAGRSEGWHFPPGKTANWRQLRDDETPSISAALEVSSALLPNARVWSNDIDVRTGDYIYANQYTEWGAYSGCNLYRAKQNMRFEDFDVNTPSTENVDKWEWVASYKIKEFEDKWNLKTSPDNSFYRIEVKQISEKGMEEIGGRLVLVDEKRQRDLTCYVKRLLDFLIPAWIRFENGVIIADKRSVRTASAAHSVASSFSDTCEFLPYTLTIYPYVGFDMQDVNWRRRGELNHTEAWQTEVFHDDDYESPVYIVDDLWTPENKLDWTKIVAWNKILLDNNNPMQAYMWREDYLRPDDRALIKVKLLPDCRLKLRSWSIYEHRRVPTWKSGTGYDLYQVVMRPDGRYYKARVKYPTYNKFIRDEWKFISYGHGGVRRYFWRWQLLNFYHNVPRFGADVVREVAVEPPVEPVEELTDE